MLLRRLSEAGRKQNWFTLLSGLLVVVLVRDVEPGAGLVQPREQAPLANEALNHVRSERTR